MIAVLVILYTGVVLVLFKLKLVKPRPFPIAWVVVAGILLIGGVVVAWTLGAPLSSRVVTTQYVIQLVPYVKDPLQFWEILSNTINENPPPRDQVTALLPLFAPLGIELGKYINLRAYAPGRRTIESAYNHDVYAPAGIVEVK
jgi:hypothetical protein